MIDPQDPLPEASWLWRRLFIWVVTIAACLLLGYIVQQLRGNVALVEVAKWLIGLIALLATYYLIAPSAEHIVRLIQGARVKRAAALEHAAELVARRNEGEAP